jgi:DNA replication protein DnaC
MDKPMQQDLEQIKHDIIKNKVQSVPAPSSDQKNIQTPKIYDGFKDFKVLKGTEETYKAFADLAYGKTEKYMLLCCGSTGSGKTHLINALAQVLNCYCFTWNNITRTLKSKMSDRTSSPTYDMVLDNYCKAKRLLIDDIGMGTTDSQWENSLLEEIVDERYRNRLLTVLTTNKDIRTMPERIISRFRDTETSVIVVNRGVDYRPLKGK